MYSINRDTIALLVVCGLVLVIFILEIINVIRKRPVTVSKITVFMLIITLIFASFLTFRGKELSSSDWAQLLPMLGLVIVTVFYAMSADRQANASAKMAEATSEQLLSEARPYLLIRLEDEVINLFTIVSDANRHEMPKEFKVTIRNVGKGPAINIIAAFWRSDDVSPIQPKGYLAPQEEWHTTISTLSVDVAEEIWLPELSHMVKYDFPGTVAVEYHDIHHRTWVTYLCLARFDEEAYVVEGEQNIIEVNKND